MFAFLRQQSQLRYSCAVGISATAHLVFLQNLNITPIKLFSSKTRSSTATKNEIEQQQCFTVSYLINSCGLSPEIADSISQKVHLRTSEGPDSVLSLFRDRGFSDFQISKLVRKNPSLLLSNPKKTLLPKLEFFQSLGLSRTDLAELVASTPLLLYYSLKNRLIPACDFLKRVVLLDKRVVSVLMLRPWLFWNYADKNAIPNVTLLRQIGVPQSFISSLVSGNPSVVVGSRDKFNLCVRKAIEMGFDPLKVTFVDAICVFFSMSKSAWERKMKVYNRWGLSDDDIHLAFKKFPRCMSLSEKKITSGMDFLVNEIGVQSTTIARTPKTLAYSLEKRIIPRCSVIRVLLLNGLIKKDRSLNTLLSISEKSFLDAFVTKYQDQVPQLLSVYQKKTDVLELGIGNEGAPKVKTAIVYQGKKISTLE